MKQERFGETQDKCGKCGSILNFTTTLMCIRKNTTLINHNNTSVLNRAVDHKQCQINEAQINKIKMMH